MDAVVSSFGVAMWDIVKWMTERHVTGCLLRCKRMTYSLENVMQPVTYAKVNGTAEVYLYMSDRVETQEEYRLFGLNAIISSVGGSLGLFLGFSCLNALNILRKRVANNYLA